MNYSHSERFGYKKKDTNEILNQTEIKGLNDDYLQGEKNPLFGRKKRKL